MLSDDSSSHLLNHSDSAYKQSSGGTSNPRPFEVLSVFGEGSCGEPLSPQHIRLDFTPNEGDNEIVQKKVCSFWQFINNSLTIQNLKVKSEKVLYPEASRTDIAPIPDRPEVNNVTNVTNASSVAGAGDSQALHMLEFAKEKNLINTLFEAKIPQSMCTLSSREYEYSDVLTEPTKKEKIKHVCKCTPCSNPKCRNKNALAAVSEELGPLSILSRRMNEWDATHPKSMEPPGHPPTLQRCVIQRQVFPSPL